MAAYCATLLFFGVLAAEDIRKKEVSVYKVLIFAICGVVYRAGKGQFTWVEVTGGLIPGGMLVTLSFLSKESIGYGDGIAVMVLGIWMGGRFAVLSVCAGMMLSGIYAAFCLIRHKKEPVPFIPFLLLGMEVVLAYA